MHSPKPAANPPRHGGLLVTAIVVGNLLTAYGLSASKEVVGGDRLRDYEAMLRMPLGLVHLSLLLLPTVCLLIGGIFSVQSGRAATWRKTLWFAAAAFIPAIAYGILI